MTPSQWALDFGNILVETIEAESDHLQRIDTGIRIAARTQNHFESLDDLSAEEAASAIWDGYEVRS